MIIKLFNILSSDIITSLKENSLDFPGGSIEFVDEFMESKVIIFEDCVDFKFISDFCSLFKNNIYAFEDVSIYEMAARYLSVRDKKLSIVELGSGGMIASNIMANSYGINLFDESYGPMSQISITKIFDIDEKNLKPSNLVSFKNTFDIASFMRERTTSDIVIANMCVINDNNDINLSSLQPKGLSFISIGDRDGIETKKYIFNGDVEKIIERVAKMSCFLLINKLK